MTADAILAAALERIRAAHPLDDSDPPDLPPAVVILRASGLIERLAAAEAVIDAAQRDVADCHYCDGTGFDPDAVGEGDEGLPPLPCPTCGRLAVALAALDALTP